MDRTNFYAQATVNGVKELDFLNTTLSKFSMRRAPAYHRIQGHEVSRPDLISFRYYRTVKYWWLICMVNKILNPLVDFSEGLLIEIPDVRDIYDFTKKYRQR